MLHHVFGEIDTLRAEIDNVRSDRVLSDFGKGQKLTRLNQVKTDLQARTIAAVKSEITGYKSRYYALSQREREANDQAAKVWDFNRLSYNAALVRGVVDRAGSSPRALAYNDPFSAIRAEYDRARTSGDPHLWRAWAEHGPVAIRARYGDDTRAGDLIRSMASDLPKITTTPELAKVWTEQRGLTESILELSTAVDQAAGFFGSDYLGISPMRQALFDSGLSIETTYNPADLAHFTTTTVSFAESGEAAAVAAAE